MALLYDTVIPPPIFRDGDKPTDPVAIKAQELHTAILDAAKAVRDTDGRYRAAIDELRQVGAERRSELHAGDVDDKRELELAEGLKLAQIKADPEAHQARMHGAKGRLEDAANAYHHYCQYHLGDLRDALAPEAEAAANALAEAVAAVVPFRERYMEAYQASVALASSIRPPRRLTPDEATQWSAVWTIPMDGSAPLPSGEAVATWVGAHRPFEPEESPTLANADPETSEE